MELRDEIDSPILVIGPLPEVSNCLALPSAQSELFSEKNTGAATKWRPIRQLLLNEMNGLSTAVVTDALPT